MKRNYIIGNRIYLSPLSKKDITLNVLKWLKDREVTKYIESESPKALRGLKLFYGEIINNKNNKIYAIYVKKDKKHIGNIKLGNINRKHAFADIAIMIGDKNYWGKGYCQESIAVLLKYAFKKLGLHKIFLSVCEKHKAARRAYSKVGFKTEGRLRKVYYHDGKHFDRIYMGILKEDFRER